MAPRIAPTPTYYISPTLDCTSNGVIAIGNIFADSLYPEYPLSLQDKSTPPKFSSVHETPGTIYADRTRTEGFQMWAKFVEIFSAKVGGNHKEHQYVGYQPSEVITQVIDDGGPALEDIRKRVLAEPRLREHTNIDGYGIGKSLYMIAGRKVARNLRYSFQHDDSFAANAVGSGQVAQDISLGAGDQGSVDNQGGRSGLIKDDIIFAYRLLVISPKGILPNKDLKVDVYRKDALLDDEDKTMWDDAKKAKNFDVAWSEATSLAPDEADIVNLGEGTEKCVLVVRK